MKIITWNCNGAFRKKYRYLPEDADILIIQECENPEESKDSCYRDWAVNSIWIGDYKHKGLGVFAKPSILLERLFWRSTYQDQRVKHFLPCLINGKVPLLAVWTHYNNSPTYAYIGQFWKYLELNRTSFKDIIVAGDFNSNSIWDKKNRTWNHSDVVTELGSLGVKSFYHEFFQEEQGKENRPTFFFQKNVNKPYHIDYCFGSECYRKYLQNVSMGKYDDWKVLSDHVPLTVTLAV